VKLSLSHRELHGFVPLLQRAGMIMARFVFGGLIFFVSLVPENVEKNVEHLQVEMLSHVKWFSFLIRYADFMLISC